MTLVNEGLILADGGRALVIDTGSHIITNSGMLEATGSGAASLEFGGASAEHTTFADGGDGDLILDQMRGKPRPSGRGRIARAA